MPGSDGERPVHGVALPRPRQNRGEVRQSRAAMDAGGRRVGSRWGQLRLALMSIPVIAAVLSAAFAPLIAPHDPLAQDLDRRLRPPFWLPAGSVENPLGTDQIGRDVLSRVIYGARVSLPIGLAAALLGAVLGISIGAIAGYFRGRVDSI